MISKIVDFLFKFFGLFASSSKKFVGNNFQIAVGENNNITNNIDVVNKRLDS